MRGAREGEETHVHVHLGVGAFGRKYGTFRASARFVLRGDAAAMAPGRASGLFVVVVGEEVRVPFLHLGHPRL